MRALFRSLALPAVLLLAIQSRISACGLNWEASFAETLSAAKETNRLALVFITGSDWSPRSIRLDGDVWMKPEFFEFAVRNFALFNADFPQRVKLPPEVLADYTDLARRYHVKHFPTMLVLRPDGSEVDRLEYSSETAAQVLHTLQADLLRAGMTALPATAQVASP